MVGWAAKDARRTILVRFGDLLSGNFRNHVSCELVGLIDRPVKATIDYRYVPQVTDDKIIGCAGGKAGLLQIDTTHPTTVSLQTYYQMATDETAGSTNKSISQGGTSET